MVNSPAIARITISTCNLRLSSLHLLAKIRTGLALRLCPGPEHDHSHDHFLVHSEIEEYHLSHLTFILEVIMFSQGGSTTNSCKAQVGEEKSAIMPNGAQRDKQNKEQCTQGPRVVSNTLTRIWLKLACYQRKKYFAEQKAVF